MAAFFAEYDTLGKIGLIILIIFCRSMPKYARKCDEKIIGGKILRAEKTDNIRSKMTELLRNELPVLRAKARVSQEELAKKIGISRQTYSSLETGKREMSWTTFLALIAYFQNNENTNKMISEINELSEGIEMLMESPVWEDEK